MTHDTIANLAFGVGLMFVICGGRDVLVSVRESSRNRFAEAAVGIGIILVHQALKALQ